MSEAPAQPVYLLKGSDSSLVSQALSSLVGQLVGDRPFDFTFEEVAADASVGAVVDACQTPALLTDRRVVVVRDAGRFRADEVDPLIGYLGAPMPSTSLVLVAGGGPIPTRVQKAVKERGHVVDVSAPAGKGRAAWFAEQTRKVPIKLDRAAADLLNERLGEELGQLEGILDALIAAYGEGAQVTASQIEPFLGAGGAGAPWELTDAIDTGDVATALAQLHRMLDAGRRHPLVVIATLQRHILTLLGLDGSGAKDEVAAAELLGIARYPAKKALAQSSRLGTAAIARGVQLVAEADVDLRGKSGWQPELVLEVLVARLCRLTPRGRPRFASRLAVARS